MKKLILISIIFFLSIIIDSSQIGFISDSILGDFEYDSVIGSLGAFNDMLTLLYNVVAIPYSG